MNLIHCRPPRFAMAMLAVATAIHLLLPWQLSYPFPVIFFPVLVVAAGFAVMMVAWWQFKQRKVAICPTTTTAHLITDGIYRWFCPFEEEKLGETFGLDYERYKASVRRWV